MKYHVIIDKGTPYEITVFSTDDFVDAVNFATRCRVTLGYAAEVVKKGEQNG